MASASNSIICLYTRCRRSSRGWGYAGALLLLAVVLTGGLHLGTLPSSAQSSNRAGLVVRYGDGSVETRCIAFNEADISGIELLQRSGVSVIVESGSMFGGAVCKIGPEGCDYPLTDCFCQCQGIDCVYWAYYLHRGSHWEYSNVGAGGTRVRNGDVQGWSWGVGDFGISGTQPPLIPFDQICVPPATPTNTPAPPPTVTPTATPTATPTPAPASIEFWVAKNEVPAGDCTTIGWRISGATAAYLNGEGVIGEEVRQVCPTTDTTFTLRVVSQAGEVDRKVSVRVLPQTATPTPPITAMPAPSPTPQSGGTSAPAPTATPAVIEPTPEEEPSAEATDTPAAIAEAAVPSDTPAPTDTLTPLPATDTPPAPTMIAMLVEPADTTQVWAHAAGPAKAESNIPTPVPVSHAAQPRGYTPSPSETGYRSLVNYGIFFLLASLIAGLAAWSVRRQLRTW